VTRPPINATQRRVLTDLLSIPTAPFAEHQVIAHVERFCDARNGVARSRDAAGNVLVRVRRGSRRVKRPVCITAHLDHPGFVTDRMIGKDRVRAFWRGGVPKAYFVGSGVRFDVDGAWVRGTVRSIRTVRRDGRAGVETAVVDVPRSIPSGSIGMWDLPDPRIRGSRIYARACDDLAGAAAMMCAIDALVRSRTSCDAYFLFTRAEEVGFVGAIAAAKSKTIPSKCFVAAMETSSELPDARMGDGPILRVGDKASAFTPAVTAYCHRVAGELARSDRSFRYQRKLMDGGTCESSAYCALGYEATGLCVALGNYHNVDRRRGRIGPEYIDLGDFACVVKWFVALARAPFPYTGRDDALRNRIAGFERAYRTLLRGTRAAG
jgi:endoglucanase